MYLPVYSYRLLFFKASDLHNVWVTSKQWPYTVLLFGAIYAWGVSFRLENFYALYLPMNDLLMQYQWLLSEIYIGMHSVANLFYTLNHFNRLIYIYYRIRFLMVTFLTLWLTIFFSFNESQFCNIFWVSFWIRRFFKTFFPSTNWQICQLIVHLMLLSR